MSSSSSSSGRNSREKVGSPTSPTTSSNESSKIISTISSSSHSKSLDDVRLVDLMDFTDNKIPPSNTKVIHGHSIPSGWLCNYDDETDRYSFEYQGVGVGIQETGQGISNQVANSTEPTKLSTRDEAVTAITPTMDHMVQTSRRPTLNLFECKYGYHFPTSPTSSMISDLAKEVQKASTGTGATQRPKSRPVGFGKAKLTVPTDEEEQAKRLADMFPTATRPVVDQMIRIYHGREGLIKAALISLGYKRATEYGSQQQAAQSPIMLMLSKPASKKLYDKLVSYFPDKDEQLIKELMYRHKEVEHEIISALVEAKGDGSDDIPATSAAALAAAAAGKLRSSDGRAPKRLDKNGAMMKLRYLKFLFPTCQEIELYHLLHCNDLNAQKVIEEVERKGHKRANIDEVMQNRKSQLQQMKAQQAALVAKEKLAPTDPVQLHKNRTKPMVSQARANNLRDNLKKNFPEESIDDALLLIALEAADYNESMAKKFLDDMGPIDESLYKEHYEFHREQEPAVVLYPCKGIQKGDDSSNSFTSFAAHESVSIPKSVVECDTALALLKVDASTYTEDDFDRPKFSHAKGRRANLALGSIFKSLEVKESLRKGAIEGLRLGSQYEQICHQDPTRQAPNGRASGHKPHLALGAISALRSGHNPRLTQRRHPFYEKTRTQMGQKLST